MAIALLKYRDALYALCRCNARTLSAQDLSQTISFARISLIVGLVFLHYQEYPNSTFSPFRGLDVAHHGVATFVNSFVLFFFFSVVPLLSMVSGWLFFSFAEEDATHALVHRMRRRFFSLYLPLVFWNALFLAILVGLFIHEPGDALFDDLNIRFESAGPLDYVNAIFGITKRPVGFQFWFVRDLFVTALVSPLLWLLLRRAAYLGLVLLGLAWLAGNDLFIFFRSDVVFFFYLGGLLRLRGAPLEIGRRATMVLVAVYVVLVALRTLAPYYVDVVDPPPLLAAATRGMRLVGVLACWGVFLQLAPTRVGAVVARYGGLAFFLHAAHYPLLAEVKILLWNLVPAETDAWMVAHYGASVVVTVAIGIGAGVLLARAAPNWFALLNGGRMVG
jgi:succinoglycan biosynthesis protein ExoH